MKRMKNNMRKNDQVSLVAFTAPGAKSFAVLLPMYTHKRLSLPHPLSPVPFVRKAFAQKLYVDGRVTTACRCP